MPAINFGLKQIHYVARKGNVDLIKILTSNGADINSIDKHGLNVIHYALRNDNIDLVIALTAIGSGTDASVKYGSHALHWAATNGDVELLKFFVVKGIYLNARDQSGCHSIHLAPQHGHVDILNTLLRQRVDLNASDDSGRCAIHWAAENGNVEIVKKLIWEGCDLNAADINGWEAIHLAAMKNKTSIIEVLFDSRNAGRLSVNNQTNNDDRLTPLSVAISSVSFSAVVYLVGRHADVNVREGYGRTAIYGAFMKWNYCVLVVKIANTKGSLMNARQSGNVFLFNQKTQVHDVFTQQLSNFLLKMHWLI